MYNIYISMLHEEAKFTVFAYSIHHVMRGRGKQLPRVLRVNFKSRSDRFTFLCQHMWDVSLSKRVENMLFVATYVLIEWTEQFHLKRSLAGKFHSLPAWSSVWDEEKAETSPPHPHPPNNPWSYRTNCYHCQLSSSSSRL